jgi:hypothetical protein
MSKSVKPTTMLQDDDPRIPAIVRNLANGSTLIAESRALGFSHNGPLRRALRKFLGSDGYQRLPLAENARRRMNDARRHSAKETRP